MKSSKPIATPRVVNEKLSNNEVGSKVDASVYRSLIGSPLYLCATRLDLMFAANFLSRFMYSPSQNHLGVVKRVLRQEVVAQSSTETEYISTGAIAKQAIRLRKLLIDLRQSQEDATVIWVYNKSVIAIAKNPVQHERTKHSNVKFHAIREAENNGEVN
ncbi:UNVERIFIED_CONTAM: Copia protein [Sesamum latifolium]|uniref:Copia protein n=1 Tax=Sesamum latifolium TaxID=2727402 RepID=A0AAW2UYH2_9LAMI